MDIIASRNFNTAYVFLDIVFLIVLAVLLVVKKKYVAALWGLFGGILYFVVDYGIFHLLTGSRHIEGGDLFLVLLWMSMSYGFTNFVWIWLALDRDKHLAEWTVLILAWWIACPMLSELFAASTPIHIWRTTGSYHGVMGGILFVSYLAVIIYNFVQKDPALRWNIVRLCLIGVAVQFGWEFTLLIGGIRSVGVDVAEQIRTLVVNSLVETNLGMPLIYIIYLAVGKKVDESLRKRKLTLSEVMLENRSNSVF